MKLFVIHVNKFLVHTKMIVYIRAHPTCIIVPEWWLMDCSGDMMNVTASIDSYTVDFKMLRQT